MIQFDCFAIFTLSLRSPAEANTFLFFFIALTFLCKLSIYLSIYLSIVVRDLIYSCATNCISIGCDGRAEPERKLATLFENKEYAGKGKKS